MELIHQLNLCKPSDTLEMIRISEYHLPVVGLAYNHWGKRNRWSWNQLFVLLLLVSNKVLCKVINRYYISEDAFLLQTKYLVEINRGCSMILTGLAPNQAIFSRHDVLTKLSMNTTLHYMHGCLTLCTAVTFFASNISVKKSVGFTPKVHSSIVSFSLKMVCSSFLRKKNRKIENKELVLAVKERLCKYAGWQSLQTLLNIWDFSFFPGPDSVRSVLYLKNLPIWQCMGTFKTSKNKPKVLLHKTSSISKCSWLQLVLYFWRKAQTRPCWVLFSASDT